MARSFFHYSDEEARKYKTKHHFDAIQHHLPQSSATKARSL